MNTQLVALAESYVVNFLKTNLPAQTIFHSISHTQDVVATVKLLADKEEVSEEDALCVQIAAWFHDTGYAKGSANHEEHSITEVVSFLETHKIEANFIEKIVCCIKATEMPQAPKNKIEQILCDADLQHIATDAFETRSKLLRTEWDLLEGREMTDVEWYECNANFLKKHNFYTDYAFRNWTATKANNILANEKKLKKAIEKAALDSKSNSKTKKEVSGNTKNRIKADKTIETMYRVTLRNHIKLSDIADTKANILLSVNAIILSLALANLFPKLDKPDNAYLITPTIVFLLTAVTSMIFAIISTRPKVTSGTFTDKDVADKKVNLLFFGNFHKMPLEVFDKGIFTLIEDKEYLYKSLNKDLYFLGIVLARKYRLLRLTYSIFMIGIIASVIAFGVAFYNLGL